ncbi:MAG: hypothetical protein ABSB61_13170 [Anaerolineales bacterium]|jgi:hypothetical protein
MPAEDVTRQVQWLDEERRKEKADRARLEEKLAGVEAQLAAQAKLLGELGNQYAKAGGKIKPGQMEELLARHRQETSRAIEAIEKHRLEAEEQASRARATEREGLDKTVADIYRQLSLVAEIERALELRREEAGRLSAAVQDMQKVVERSERHEEDRSRTIAAMEEARRQDVRRMGEIQGESQAVRQKNSESDARLEALESASRRIEARLTELGAADLERRTSLSVWQEQQSATFSERDRQWREWERVLSAAATQMKELAEHMEAYAETHRLMRQALEDLRGQKERMDQRLHEIEEIVRLNSDRVHQEWSTFLADDQKRWTAQDLTRRDEWQEHDRQNKKSLERLTQLDEQVTESLEFLRALQESDRARLEAVANLLREWLARVEQPF